MESYGLDAEQQQLIRNGTDQEIRAVLKQEMKTHIAYRHQDGLKRPERLIGDDSPRAAAKARWSSSGPASDPATSPGRLASSIERADEVLYLLAELAPTSWIHQLNPSAESMIGIYRPRPGSARGLRGARRAESCGECRQGRNVCMVTYGHPAVLDDSCHEAVRRSRAEDTPRSSSRPSRRSTACSPIWTSIQAGTGCSSSKRPTSFSTAGHSTYRCPSCCCRSA